MKRSILKAAALLLLTILLAACTGKSGERALEQSRVWSLGDRYTVNYSSLQYVATYEVKGELFYLTVSRNVKETGMSKRVRESRTENEIVYSLCESKKTGDDGKAVYTYYECFTGSFRYVIGNEKEGFYVEDYLSMDEAIVLIGSPESTKGGVSFCASEWNAQYRTDPCNLEILIRINDGGALVKSLPATYQAQTENGETFYVSSIGDDIVYTDGSHSVQIWQANRAGQTAPSYLNLSECKAILALLKAD